jgi:hypothetical protein
MKRNEFMGVLLGFVSKKVDTWLPEETTEEAFLDIFQQRLYEHNDVIRKVLIKSNERTHASDN